MSVEPERRIFNLSELRVEKRANDEPSVITGHAAVFNEQTEIWWFKEEIMPGAFRNAIMKSDVRALFNHDPNFILGRNKSGTLRMQEDDRGLAVEIMPPETQLIKDMVMTPMERGDLNQMSFGFTVKEEIWIDKKGEMSLRQIKEVDELFDVSVVTYPAYKKTDAKLRSTKEIYDKHVVELQFQEKEAEEQRKLDEQQQGEVKQKQLNKDLKVRELQIRVKE